MTETFRKLHYTSNKFCEVDYIIPENWMSNAAAQRKGERCEFPESINTAMSFYRIRDYITLITKGFYDQY